MNQTTRYLRTGNDYNQEPQINSYSIPLSIFLGFAVFCFLGYNYMKKKNNSKLPYARYGDHIVLFC